MRYIEQELFGARNDQKTFLRAVSAVLEKEGQIRQAKKSWDFQITRSREETRKSRTVLQTRLMKRVALALSLIIALPLYGQPPTSTELTPSPSPLAHTAAAKTFEGRTLVTRAGLGVVGWFAGAAAGVLVADALPHHDCHCDDPGLTEALTGLVIGSTIGTAAAAAIPWLDRHCTYGTRFGRAFVGSVAGTVIGVLAAISIQHDVGWIAIPAGSATGAALAIGRC